MSRETIFVWYGLFMASLALFFLIALDPGQTRRRVDIRKSPAAAADVYGGEESARRAAMLDRCIIQISSQPIELLDQMALCDKIVGTR